MFDHLKEHPTVRGTSNLRSLGPGRPLEIPPAREAVPPRVDFFIFLTWFQSVSQPGLLLVRVKGSCSSTSPVELMSDETFGSQGGICTP